LDDLLLQLSSGPKTRFRDFDRRAIPSGAGVYTIWDDEDALIYVGMSGRGLRPGAPTRNAPHGLVTRLLSHAQGRRSGDQFCVYVADRFVLPSLTRGQIELISQGQESLDLLVRAHIRQHLWFRLATTATAEQAFAVERTIQSGAWPHGRPLLNGV
jgi:hypothetical protein